MILKKLVITGFKSFVKKTTFEFKESFTSVVGPNGGGKTNVVDALRWVMGEQSLKMIRCKKTEDAIFAGSTKLTRLGMAQVDLHLDNSDNRLDLDYSEVVITRKLSRKGETEYLINKKQVRLQDIIMLLAKANFGQRSYGIIGQGMITSILSANPQDRKEFFDEATGVKEFQIKRDQALNKLIRTEDNLEHAEDLLQEIEPHLKSLSRQVNKLEKRRKLEDELREIQLNFYGSTWKELGIKLKILDQQKIEVELKEEKGEKVCAGLQEKLDIAEQEESREELYQKLQQNYQEISQKRNRLLKDQIVLKGELELEEKKQGELNLIYLEKRAEEIEEHLQKTWLQIKDSERNLQKTEKLLQQKIHELKIANQSFKELEYGLLKAKEKFEKEKEILSIPEIKEELKDLFSKQEGFLKKILATDNLEQFQTVQTEAKKITKQLAELLDKLHEEKSEKIAAGKAELEQLRKKLQKALETKESLIQENNDLRLILEVDKEKINLLVDKTKKEGNEKTELSETISKTKAKWEGKFSKTEKIKEWQKKNELIMLKINVLNTELEEIQKKIEEFNQTEEEKKSILFKLQNELRGEQTKLTQIREENNRIEVELAKLNTRQGDLHQEMIRELDGQTLKHCKNYKATKEYHGDLRGDMEKLKHQLELIGGIDPETINEYAEVKERRDFLTKQLKDLRKTINSLEELIDKLDETIKKQFNKTFKDISDNFNKYFKTIFEGGSAKLSLVIEKKIEETDEQEEKLGLGKRKKKEKIISGIEIDASPPGKKVKNVHALSGGEKSMTAIALISSIIAVNAPPFVILDEVEAALDESNSEKFAAIIDKLSNKTQFVVITHNRTTMHHADVLYGVTMGKEGSSSILSVKLAEAEKMVEEEALTKN